MTSKHFLHYWPFVRGIHWWVTGPLWGESTGESLVICEGNPQVNHWPFVRRIHWWITGPLWGESTGESLVLCEGNPLVNHWPFVRRIHWWIIMLSFDFPLVNLNKLLNKQPSCWWLEMPWGSCDITAINTVQFGCCWTQGVIKWLYILRVCLFVGQIQLNLTFGQPELMNGLAILTEAETKWPQTCRPGKLLYFDSYFTEICSQGCN